MHQKLCNSNFEWKICRARWWLSTQWHNLNSVTEYCDPVPKELLIVCSGPGRADEAMQSRGDGVHPWWVRGWPVQPSAVQPTIVQSSALPVQSLTSQWVELQCRVQQLSEGEWVRRSSHQRRQHYCLHALPRPFPLDFKTKSILIFWLVWSVLISLYALQAHILSTDRWWSYIEGIAGIVSWAESTDMRNRGITSYL